MARKYIDCRQVPGSTGGCTLALSAGSEEELVAAAVQHGMAVHGYQDTPEFRGEIRQGIKEGVPPG